MANGMIVEKNGDLLIAQNAYGGDRAVAKRDHATGAMTVLADRYQGKRFVAPNDITLDTQGRIYFTDARYNSN